MQEKNTTWQVLANQQLIRKIISSAFPAAETFKVQPPFFRQQTIDWIAECAPVLLFHVCVHSVSIGYYMAAGRTLAHAPSDFSVFFTMEHPEHMRGGGGASRTSHS